MTNSQNPFSKHTLTTSANATTDASTVSANQPVTVDENPSGNAFNGENLSSGDFVDSIANGTEYGGIAHFVAIVQPTINH